MIFSKMNLLVVEMTRADRAIPVLDNVHFRADGTTIGTNGMSVVAVSPVAESTAAKVPLDSSRMFNAETVSAETIKEIMKNMPRDTMFSGVLEHCDYSGGKFKLTDGKRKREIVAKTFPRDYVPYNTVFEKAGKSVVRSRSVVNLRRLLDVLDCVNKMCADSAKNQAVFLEFTESDDIIISSENAFSGQRVIGVVKTYNGNEGKWLEPSAWSDKLTGRESDDTTKVAKVKRIAKVKKSRA